MDNLETWLEEDFVQNNQMDKDKLCKTVAELCVANKTEFIFIVPGHSCWSVKKDNHLKNIVKFHEETDFNDRN